MKIKSVFLTAILAPILCSSSKVWAYSGGTGEPNTPYQIADVNDLIQLSSDTGNYNRCFILTANIVFDPNNPAHFFTQSPIAPDANNLSPGFQGTPFTGVFDGNGHAISNLAISAATQDYVGLFGYVGSSGQFLNLGVENVNIFGRNYVGGLVGGNYSTITSCHATGLVGGTYSVGGLVGGNGGALTSCYATGAVSGTGQYSSCVGGLAGGNGVSGTINACYATGSVDGTETNVGGLVGGNSGTITSCHATGSVSGTDTNVGGLAGGNGVSGTINACYATGSISGIDRIGVLVGGNSGMITSCHATGSVSESGNFVGGLVGLNDESGTIHACYATGSISGIDRIGGLVGYNYRGKVIQCYSTGKPMGISNVGGLCGQVTIGVNYEDTGNFWDEETSMITTSAMGTRKTTAQMKTLSTFTDAGWDFVNTWWMPVGSYPHLIWEKYSGGSGTEVDPYRINSITDLYQMMESSSDWDKQFILIANIVFDPNNPAHIFTQSPIAPDTSTNSGFQGTQFTGVFDGNDHTISNLTITASTQDFVGLFGNIGFDGQIRNLGVENVNITGRIFVGGLVGVNYGSLTSCYATGSVTGTDGVGGLVGVNYGSLTSCYTTGSVTSRTGVGGLVGSNYGPLISCYATGSVSATDSVRSFVGGLAGRNFGTLTSCHATGAVSGTGHFSTNIGGLVGLNNGMLTSCHATGAVTGYQGVGGLVGNNISIVTSCYATGLVTGTRSVGGLVGINGGTLTSCYATGSVSGAVYYVGGLVGENYSGTITITSNYAAGIVNGIGDNIGELAGYSEVPIIIEGNVSINSSNGVYSHRWNNLVLEGSGTLNLSPDVSLYLGNSTVSCNIAGEGKIQIDNDKTLTIDGIANINLPGNENHAGIQCDGLLHVKNNVTVSTTNIQVTRLQFEGDVDISNSVIAAEAGSPYGQFFIEETVKIEDNEIHADGDRYMDLDPSVFAGLIANNIIYVTITEGVGSTRGGLFELRGDPNLAGASCPPGDFFCYLENIPDFDTHSWTIEELTLVPGAKVNLTNRFDFNNGGHNEVLYVKKLTLGENSQLNTAFNRLYYGQLIGDPNCFKNKPLLGFSLNNVACNSDNEFVSRIVHNNYTDPDPVEPDYSRTHVSRFTGASPDPQGMIRMCNLTDIDPGSPTYNQLINARAKALFAKASEEKILVYFQYLFETSDPAVQLVIYLTDASQIMDHSDPDFGSHCIEVARLLPPLPGQPGSEGSGRFGVFSKEVFRQNLDFIRGTRIEFELLGPDGSCILIDNWDPQVWCSQLYCSDIDGDYGVNELDFLTVLAECGATAGITDENNSKACLDGAFSRDGYVDSYDITTWDWLLNTTERPEHLCGACLSLNSTDCVSNPIPHSPLTTPPVYFQSSGKGLLVAGKQGALSDTNKRNDMLAAMDSSGQRTDSTLLNNRTNGKLVLSPDAQLYQVNIEEGLIRLSDCNSVVSPAALPFANEPRYNRSSTIYVGLQNESDNWYGRPILDAAFDNNGFVYIVPVVVDPVGYEPYLAAAKLQLLPGQTPGYSVIRLYDDPDADLANDNRNLTGLREVKVDEQGHLYVLNAHKDNESNILWKYDAQTGVLIDRLELDNDANIPAPTGLYVSDSTGTLYLASSQNAADADSTFVCGLDTNTLSVQRTVTIHNMGHVTDITENPETGCIYVSGFTLSNIPEYLTVNAMPFYEARLAEIPPGNNNPVTATDISNSLGDPNDYLALPVSIVWLGDGVIEPDPCQGADITGDGSVTLADFAVLASQWLSMPGVPSADIAPNPVQDNYVDIQDLAVLTENWLETGCNNP